MTSFSTSTPSKSHKTIIVAMFIIIIMSLFTSLPPSLASKDYILCPLSQNTVTIDGGWTYEDEWLDAFEHNMTFYEGSGICYFRVKHDETILYILIDFVTDVSLNLMDAAAVSIDSDHDSSLSPQKDDFRWSISFWNDPSKPGSSYVTGTGEKEWPNNWNTTPSYMVGDASISSEHNLYSSGPHRIYEFSIPLSNLNSKSIGIFFWVTDTYKNNASATAIWPSSKYDNPSQWLDLVFSTRLLHQITELTSLTYPSEDAQLEYRNTIEYVLPRDRGFIISELYKFHSTNVSGSRFDLDLEFESIIDPKKYTSMIEIAHYSLNFSLLNIEKTKKLPTTLGYKNTYVIDENYVKDIKGDGILLTRIYLLISGTQYYWITIPVAWWSENHGNFQWWSRLLQPGKYIEILDLGKLKLKEGASYNFQGRTFKTITTLKQREIDLWSTTEKWTWDKTTGILLDYISEGESTQGATFTEHCTLQEVNKKDVKLIIQNRSLKQSKDQASIIQGSLSITGNTTIHFTIIDPLGVKREVEVATDPFGEFEISFVPDQEGEWQVQAQWDGSILHNPAYNEAQIPVQQVKETTSTTYSTISRKIPLDSIDQEDNTSSIGRSEIIILILGIIIITLIFVILKMFKVDY